MERKTEKQAEETKEKEILSTRSFATKVIFQTKERWHRSIL